MTLNIAIICFIFLNMWVNIVVLALTSGPPNRDKNWYSGRITVPANLVFRRKIWGARDNGIPPRSTPVTGPAAELIRYVSSQWQTVISSYTPGKCFLPISVRLAMCPAERERNLSGCQASGINPELPFHVALVLPLQVPPLLCLQALVSGCNVNRIDIAISWIAIGIFVFSRGGGYEKAVDFM